MASLPLTSLKNFLVRNIALHPQRVVKYLWDCPRQPDISQEQWYRYDSPVFGTESPFYMRHINVDGILSGLTVSCDMWTNMSFHAHGNLTSSSKPSPAEVNWAYGDQLVWIYFPISPGEKICGVWVLTLPGGLATVAVRILTPSFLSVRGLTTSRSTQHLGDRASSDPIRNIVLISKSSASMEAQMDTLNPSTTMTSDQSPRNEISG
jgi:hypothetical protein